MFRLKSRKSELEFLVVFDLFTVYPTWRVVFNTATVVERDQYPPCYFFPHIVFCISPMKIQLFTLVPSMLNRNANDYPKGNSEEH